MGPKSCFQPLLLAVVELSKRKEVNTMNYIKPEIAVLGEAAHLIQGSQNSGPEGAQSLETASADCEMDD